MNSYQAPWILAPLTGYFIFAGLNALQTGHTYMALKYLEFRIMSQVTGLAFIGAGAYYYKYRKRSDLMVAQPYGPYRHAYGKRFIEKSLTEQEVQPQ